MPHALRNYAKVYAPVLSIFRAAFRNITRLR